MRLSGIVLSFFSVLLLSGMVNAGAPIDGNYQSTDLGGPVYVGRYSEGWDSGGSAFLVGTTLNAQSWSGTELATQWKYWCGTETGPAVVLTNFVNASGNGTKTFMKTFSGGYIWLSGSGPWANGDPEYIGTINYYVEFETVSYTNWVPVAATTNTQANASFDEYPNLCMAFYIGNGSRVATTEIGETIPAGYPEFLDTDCNATRTEGAVWDFFSVTLSIVDCAVDTEDASWGKIKSLHE
ncbi:MAG: hypothetical protein JW814_09505 [Candidatus Krumholzibacteriota bacterium]|nr:hypothetical protein [Candidatus Krumholzibacteriota bacterium]